MFIGSLTSKSFFPNASLKSLNSGIRSNNPDDFSIHLSVIITLISYGIS